MLGLKLEPCQEWNRKLPFKMWQIFLKTNLGPLINFCGHNHFNVTPPLFLIGSSGYFIINDIYTPSAH